MEPTAGTLREFQDFCERLEIALDDNGADPKPKQAAEKEKGNKKHRRNNRNDEDSKHYCMLHGHNPTHTTEQCRTLKKEAEKHKKGSENGEKGRKKRNYNPSKEEIHALAAYAKQAMKKEYDNVTEELKTFENMSVSSNEDPWKMGPGVNNSCECFMVTNNENLSTKNSKIRFDSLD